MGLTQILRTQVQFGINKLGDLNQSLTFFHVTPGVYDPATGLTADVVVQIAVTAPVVRMDEKVAAAQFPGLEDIQVVLAPYAALKGIVPIPKVDYFVNAAGQHFEILRVRTPQSSAITKIYVSNP